MENMKTLTIAGQNISVIPLGKNELKGLWLELIANFEIGKFEFNGTTMLIFSPKQGVNYSPLQLKNLSARIEKAKGLPSVFYFDRLLTYERDRLVEKDVYFVVSDKYAFVPSLIINRKDGDSEVKKTFFPSTQYIMLYHLQAAPINGKSIRDLEALVPYKYKTIAKSIKQLERLGLLRLSGSREKNIVIEQSNRDLWDAVQPHLIGPIKTTYYSSEPINSGLIAGTAALSHYSMLAPEEVLTKAVTLDQFAELKRNNHKFYTFEDVQRIEVWKYPPITESAYADKLSLYLTLKDDNDPRVQKELETMINEMPW